MTDAFVAVNLMAGGTPLSTGPGAADAGTLRVYVTDPGGGGGGGSAAPYAATPKGYQQLALAAGGGAAALIVPAGATFAYAIAEGADARWRDDGTAPTAAVGMPIRAGDAVLVLAGDLAALRFICQAAAGAGTTLNVSYYA